MNLVSIIKEKATSYATQFVAIRQHLHKYPELSFKEFNTSKYICSQLDKMGVEYQSGFVETGIVAHINGVSKSEKTFTLRADIDALPIIEENEIGYKSENKGIMHACGHDVHTACLLGAAKILNEVKDQFKGTVKLIFQPGEERLPGGASLMLKEGALHNPDTHNIIGQHVYPDLEAGKVGFRAGQYMASADEIYITVKGKGGHAALPHKLVDPIVIAANIIVSLQQIISRNCQPNLPSVLSFGKIEGLGSTNVIPDKVKLEGTFRAMNEEWRFDAHEKIKKAAISIAEGLGGTCDVNIKVGYPFLVNDADLTHQSKKLAQQYLGSENVIDLDKRMTAEDFAYYSQLYPACFYRLGTRNETKNIISGLHTSTFNIDEKAIETGMGLMAYIAACQVNLIE